MQKLAEVSNGGFGTSLIRSRSNVGLPLAAPGHYLNAWNRVVHHKISFQQKLPSELSVQLAIVLYMFGEQGWPSLLTNVAWVRIPVATPCMGGVCQYENHMTFVGHIVYLWPE